MNIDIYFKDKDLTIIGQYIKGEDEVTHYPDGSGYPGVPAHFYIDYVLNTNSDDITDDYTADEILQMEMGIEEDLKG